MIKFFYQLFNWVKVNIKLKLMKYNLYNRVLDHKNQNLNEKNTNRTNNTTTQYEKLIRFNDRLINFVID